MWVIISMQRDVGPQKYKANVEGQNKSHPVMKSGMEEVNEFSVYYLHYFSCGKASLNQI